MSVYQIYFSPTNYTKRIVNTVSSVFGASQEVDLCQRTVSVQRSFSEEDLCVIGVPAYGGRVPYPALERMSGYQGNGASAVLLVSYGNRDYDDTLKELQDFLKERGFCCIAAIAAVAEHSIMHQFAAGRPDEQDRKELVSFAEKIAEKLKDGKKEELQRVKGKAPYREYHGVPFKPAADDTCKACGICASHCPVGAIPVQHPKITDPEICISCMRCMEVCPIHARKLEEALVKAAVEKMQAVCAVPKKNELFL